MDGNKAYIVSWSGFTAIDAKSPEEAIEIVKGCPQLVVLCAHSYKAKERPVYDLELFKKVANG